MTIKNSSIEQLRQELLSQDSSLEGQKKEFFGLFERMEHNIPEIEQDPMFFGNLKNKLRYHLITRHEPTSTINIWQKFMLYGFPTLAIGVALLYILPTIPFSQQDQRLTKNKESSIIREQNITEQSADMIEHTEITTLPIQEPAQSHTRTIEPLSHKDIVENTEMYDATFTDQPSQDSEIMPASYKTDDTMMMSIPQTNEEILLLNKDFSLYSRGTTNQYRQLDYNINNDDNIFIDGLLRIKSCDKLFTLHNPISLSRGPNLWHVTGIPMNSTDSKSYDIILTIINKEINHIEGYEKLCQK